LHATCRRRKTDARDQINSLSRELLRSTPPLKLRWIQ
jgi:hypothetical protein